MRNMKALSGQQLREEWNNFRLTKKHVWLPEAPLIGGKESTAMFNIAGMQQVIPYLSGQKHPLGKRLFNIQKCIRTVDIDEVGDASHLTFFEMMGNRSLGDYFKKESVQRSREFLVDVLGFDPQKLAATVYEGDAIVPLDQETIGYWEKAGLSSDRICPMPAENNRRSPGPVGPCGPDTEIFYRVGKEKLPPKKSTPKTDENNWLEIWNNVFMEYYRSRRIILTDAGHCLYNNETGKIEDENLLNILKSWSDMGGKVIMVTNKPDISGFEKVPFPMDIFTLSENPSKKDPKYFQTLMGKYNISPDDIVYFDHKQEHVDAALKAGIKLSTFYSDYASVKDFIEDNKYKLTKLKDQNVDTGMGFERMCTVLQGKESVYETDVFASLLELITKYVGLSYTGNERRYRIVADHLRTSFFLVKDGVTPSNEGRGYVLRRIIRRMYYNIMLLAEIEHKAFINFLNESVGLIASSFGLTTGQAQISSTLEKEITQFQKTISHGQKLIRELFTKQKKGSVISGKDIFKLYDTFGFPLELTKEIALENGYKIDEAGFEKEMQLQQERSRKGSKDMFTQDVDRSKYVTGIPPTKFVGYEKLSLEKITLLKDFEVNGKRILIFDATPFYAEGGGQMSDRGVVILDNGEQLQISEVKKYEGVFLHFVK